MGAEAQAHYDRGLNLYAAHQYTASVAELRQGFALEPRREFLFAEAQALRLAGACGQAILLYHQFIDTAPPPLQLQAARMGLDRCGPDRARSAGSVAPAVMTSPPPQAVRPSRPSLGREPIAWWRDPGADLSIGAGIVALGAATGFENASRRAQDQARGADMYLLNDQAWTRARQRREIAVTALIGGLVLVAAGGARLLFVRGRADAESDAARLNAPVVVTVTENTTALMWRGAFR